MYNISCFNAHRKVSKVSNYILSQPHVQCIPRIVLRQNHIINLLQFLANVASEEMSKMFKPKTNSCLRQISAWFPTVQCATLGPSQARPEVFWMSRGNPRLGEILNQENWRRWNSLHANTLQF